MGDPHPRCRRRRPCHGLIPQAIVLYCISKSFAHVNCIRLVVAFRSNHCWNTPKRRQLSDAVSHKSTQQISFSSSWSQSRYKSTSTVNSDASDDNYIENKKPVIRKIASRHSKQSKNHSDANLEETSNDPEKRVISSSSPPLFSSTSDPSKKIAYLAPPSSKISREKHADLPDWGFIANQPSTDTSLLSYPMSVLPPSTFPTPTSSIIYGVIPVSELFYKPSTSNKSSTGKEDIPESASLVEDSIGDDEELPFSAEQSDRLSTPRNKIKIRRNRAVSVDSLTSSITSSSFFIEDMTRGKIEKAVNKNRVIPLKERNAVTGNEKEKQQQLENVRVHQHEMNSVIRNSINYSSVSSTHREVDESTSEVAAKAGKTINKKQIVRRDRGDFSSRKMLRRGMEMLVGGEPINADPPQRTIELNYHRKQPGLWSSAITTNSPDFGPLLDIHSAANVSKFSTGLFCENFLSMTQKWKVCPEDLKAIALQHELRTRNTKAAQDHALAMDAREHSSGHALDFGDKSTILSLIKEFEKANNNSLDDDTIMRSFVGFDVEEGIISDGSGITMRINPRELEPPKGFGDSKKQNSKKRVSRGGGSGIASHKSLTPKYKADGDRFNEEKVLETYTLGGELKFSLGVTKSELESGHEHGKAFRRVLREGIRASIQAYEFGFDVHIAKLTINDNEGGSSDVLVQFQLNILDARSIREAERVAKEVNGALANAMDEGKMALALAHAAGEEKGWPSKLRTRIVEEFLLETEDDEDKDFIVNVDNLSPDDGASDKEKDVFITSDFIEDDGDDTQLEMDGGPRHEQDKLWLGGGSCSIFFDYSESNLSNAPYKGDLGPYLFDAATERARQTQPRVIIIGDVHGCIDELQALLRKCDYHPGDIVIFLGDLVCKGPDSLSVVQMAREIGAIGVRGNHDFEVIRWHQAIKSGVDPPVIGSEHYFVASGLSIADLKWMYSLPWFINSINLNALFVHAGFVSGIRLAKQNPRLMMNMRSILPDGTVTSKFFNNWPWARLWDGPQTVFFGHDADRGLQQYEHAIGLDTGCVYGGKLTACILPERRIVSVNAKREYFQYRRKHFD